MHTNLKHSYQFFIHFWTWLLLQNPVMKLRVSNYYYTSDMSVVLDKIIYCRAHVKDCETTMVNEEEEEEE